MCGWKLAWLISAKSNSSKVRFTLCDNPVAEYLFSDVYSKLLKSLLFFLVEEFLWKVRLDFCLWCAGSDRLIRKSDGGNKKGLGCILQVSLVVKWWPCYRRATEGLELKSSLESLKRLLWWSDLPIISSVVYGHCVRSKCQIKCIWDYLFNPENRDVWFWFLMIYSVEIGVKRSTNHDVKIWKLISFTEESKCVWGIL